MNTNRGWLSAALGVLLLTLAETPLAASAADSAAGIYKGSYASYDAGGDFGTVTIIINSEGGAVCDFQSIPDGYPIITTGGSVVSTSPFLDMSCQVAGIVNAAPWFAVSDSSSVAGGSISGTWTSAEGVVTGTRPPTGDFQATYVSAMEAIEPAAMAGIWQGGWLGNLTILPATAGLIITYIGQNYDSDSDPTTPVAGSPLWLVSGVGPTTILPGTPVTLPMYGLAEPTPTQPFPSTIAPWGSITVTFLDCHTATATLTGPVGPFPINNLELLAGVAGVPGC